MSVTKEQVAAIVHTIAAVGTAIQDLGEVPSGHLYASVMGTLTLESYQRVIDTLKRAGLVSESGYLLKWIGPKKVVTDAGTP